jgi:hypothetical protein
MKTKIDINGELEDFFNFISSEKKKQREEFEALVSDSFDSLVWSPLVETKEPKKIKKVKKKIVKEEKTPIPTNNLLIEKSLGLLAEPSDKKNNSDPITPLNQNFVTFEELQKHYTQFISRIQQQLSTLGGGGETNLAFMTLPVRTITSSSYTLTYRDYYVGVNFPGAVTITLPKADREGRVFIIKDELGEASLGTNRYITIIPQPGNTIDDRDRAILAFDYGSLTFIWKNNSWRVV